MSLDHAVILEARDTWKWFGHQESKPALRGVSLSVSTGEMVVLAGPSGSGKTTLLSLLGALDYPSRGSVWFDGIDLSQLSDAARARIRRRLGLVFQDAQLISRMPLWENVSQPLIPLGTPRSIRRERAQIQLARVALSDFAERTPEALSGGERQRAALARALIAEPELLLADEPTASLDPDTAAMVIQILTEFTQAGYTVVVATHDPALLVHATTVYHLRSGHLE